MNRKSLDALDVCIDRIRAGASVEEALSEFPSLAAELRPLLSAARAAHRHTAGPLPVNAQTRSRVRLRAAMAAAGSKRISWWERPVLRQAFVTAAILLFLFVGGTGLAAASADSLPGDPLYVIKRSMEEVELRLATDPDEKANIEQKLYDLRIEETGELLQEQRVEPIEFAGLVEAQLGNGWSVSGIPVVVTDRTELDGSIVVGAHVEVRGTTQKDGSVLADRIKVEMEGTEDEEDGNSDASDSSESEDDRSGESGDPDAADEDDDPDESGPGSGSSTEEPAEDDDDDDD